MSRGVSQCPSRTLRSTLPMPNHTRKLLCLVISTTPDCSQVAMVDVSVFGLLFVALDMVDGFLARRSKAGPTRVGAALDVESDSIAVLFLSIAASRKVRLLASPSRASYFKSSKYCSLPHRPAGFRGTQAGKIETHASGFQSTDSAIIQSRCPEKKKTQTEAHASRRCRRRSLLTKNNSIHPRIDWSKGALCGTLIKPTGQRHSHLSRSYASIVFTSVCPGPSHARLGSEGSLPAPSATCSFWPPVPASSRPLPSAPPGGWSPRLPLSLASELWPLPSATVPL